MGLPQQWSDGRRRSDTVEFGAILGRLVSFSIAYTGRRKANISLVKAWRLLAVIFSSRHRHENEGQYMNYSDDYALYPSVKDLALLITESRPLRRNYQYRSSRFPASIHSIQPSKPQ